MTSCGVKQLGLVTPFSNSDFYAPKNSICCKILPIVLIFDREHGEL